MNKNISVDGTPLNPTAVAKPCGLIAKTIFNGKFKNITIQYSWNKSKLKCFLKKYKFIFFYFILDSFSLQYTNENNYFEKINIREKGIINNIEDFDIE